MKIAKILPIIYLIVLVFEMYLRANGLVDIEVFAKSSLMPILMIFLYLKVEKWERTHIWLLAALIFSWIGDILLLEKINIFIGGLASFLIAHICYIFCFNKVVRLRSLSNSYLGKNPLKILPFLLLGLSMLMLIKNNLGELLIPVIVYTSAIVLMGLAAVNRKDMVNNRSFNLVFVGAMLFIISDSLIALTRFYTPIPYDGVWIMLFYGVAQLMIVSGVVVEG